MNLINQYEALSDIQSLDISKCILNYAVPYCVAIYGAVMLFLQFDTER